MIRPSESSESLACKTTEINASSLPLALTSNATGASLIGRRLRVALPSTDFGSLAPLVVPLSVILYEKLTALSSLGAGVYVQVPSLRSIRLPFPLLICKLLTVKELPSISLALASRSLLVIVRVVSSFSGVSTTGEVLGASFTGVTVTAPSTMALLPILPSTLFVTA